MIGLRQVLPTRKTLPVVTMGPGLVPRVVRRSQGAVRLQVTVSVRICEPLARALRLGDAEPSSKGRGR